MTTNTWNDGYCTEIGYTYGYYPNLNPLFAKMAFLQKGIRFPDCIETACELGFGQGISLNIHAAASDTVWYGTDFNPAQASFAKDLASVSGAHVFDDSFQDFVHNKSLPDFDFIGLHGIWSWVSAANRQAIVDFIAKKLKVGGVLYISYNTFPGWAAMAPVRHLMMQHVEALGASGHGIEHNVANAMDFMATIFASQTAFERAQPMAKQRFEEAKTKDSHYLAHEYFNKDWEPCYFTDMNAWLSQAKLSYAASASLFDNMDTLILSQDQQKVVDAIKDPVLNQQVRDYMINQQFRRDLWVKGLRPIHADAGVRAFMVVLPKQAADVPLENACPRGTITLKQEQLSPILAILEDHKPHSMAELEEKIPNQSLATLWQTIGVLVGAGHVYPVEATIRPETQRRSKNLNQMIANSAESISTCAGPVIGGGLPVNEIDQLFLVADGDLANSALQALKKRGRRPVKEGKALENDDEALAELQIMAEKFRQDRLPVYKALGIV